MEQNLDLIRGICFGLLASSAALMMAVPPATAQSAQKPNIIRIVTAPQERYDILMNSFTERTWMAVITGQEINKLMATYAKYAPRKSQSLTYNGPITLSQYEHFDWIRGQLAKEGVQITLPTGN